MTASSPGFLPETPLERRLCADPDLRRGLAWGQPRWGHPEGPVGEHVAALASLIDRTDPDRAELRLLALVHDSFKYTVDADAPWSPDNDHAAAARRFAERYGLAEHLLAILEAHDAPYWLWRTRGDADAVAKVVCGTGAPRLMIRFVELDASSDGKDVTFLWWFHRTLAARRLLPETRGGSALRARSPSQRSSLYLKTFAVEPEHQLEVATAARELVARHAHELDAHGQVMVSEDGLRVLLAWSWSGSTRERLLRDGEVVRDALARHPVLAEAGAVAARVFHSL